MFMQKKEDDLTNSILNIINSSDEPLETKELEEKLKKNTRCFRD
jgi:repressor of nif and glnA expression